jgi:parvulin-like peptidyl-prolyl isomerase
MKISSAKPASTVLKAGVIVLFSAAVCFGQTKPHPAAKPAAKHPAASHAAVAKTPSPSEKVVLTVGTAKVTKAEMDYVLNNLSPEAQQAVQKQGLSTLGQEYAVMLLLSQKAVSDHLDASPEFRQQLALKKDQMLAAEEYRNMATQAKVSPDEVSAYYDAHKSDFQEATVREFVVRKKSADAKADDPGLSPKDAEARLASIQKAIAGGTDVADVAKQFNVPNVVVVEPEPRTVHRGQLLPALDKAAFELADNQFSEPVDTPNALIELQLLGRQQAELKDVSQTIENELRQQKVKVALDDLKAKANITMDPEYFKPAALEAPSSEPTP